MHALEPSRTAKVSAVGRGWHRLHHQPPWVLDDPFALPLVGPEWRELVATLSAVTSEELRRQVPAWAVARSRFTEDVVEASDCHQFVILGAGLDSFAWRRPDVVASTLVVEVDHPATQQWKVERAATLALPEHDNHVFCPVDFETDDLAERLAATPLDFSRPISWSWLGVVPYLEPDAIGEALRGFAEHSAPGSQLTVSYLADESQLDEVAQEFVGIMSALAQESGEPLRTRWTRAEAEDQLSRHGWTVTDHPDRETLTQRYFADRADGLKPYCGEGILTAQVGPAGR